MDDLTDLGGFNRALEANRPAPASAPIAAVDLPDDAPFRALGHDRGVFFFTTHEGRQLVALRAGALSKAGELIALAPLSWWEGAFQGRAGFQTSAAANSLIRACYGAGVFDPERVRGRGVWEDEGRIVLHLGDRLIVDGAAVAIPDLATRYIYEQARRLPAELAEAADDAEARRLLRLCCECSWANPDRDGQLLAGWIVVALICGALRWRPHLWITSEAGGGKSWLLDNVFGPILGPLALVVQSKTTEAGIRGELGSDARAVLMDEAETQNEADRARFQQVLDLARQSSAEGGGAIVKGTREGGSRRYLIRSCFAFASVNYGVTQAADESRFIHLALGAGTPAQFAALKLRHRQTFTPGLAARLLARCLRLIPVIRHNAEVLADAIARTGAGRRAGDTLGTVLAGARSLYDDARLTPEEADQLVANTAGVAEAAAEAAPEPEWQRALSHLVQAEAQIVTQGGRRDALTVGELIGVCAGAGGAITAEDADVALRRMGLRVLSWPMPKRGQAPPAGAELFLAAGNRSTTVAGRFAGTPWAVAWASTLARAPDALRGEEVRFTPAYKDKCLLLPLSLLVEEDQRDGGAYAPP